MGKGIFREKESREGEGKSLRSREHVNRGDLGMKRENCESVNVEEIREQSRARIKGDKEEGFRI